MAYKKDIKPWLKDNNLTWEQMGKIWDEVCEVNWKCNMIRKTGNTWSDMPMHQIKQLPTLKETTLKQIREREEKEKQEAENRRKKEEQERYYKSHFEEIILKKIDNGESLTERELSRLITLYEVESKKGDNRRWSRTVESIVELSGRFFRVIWEQGLTEMQEDSFSNQPVEVVKHTYEKTIVVTE